MGEREAKDMSLFDKLSHVDKENSTSKNQKKAQRERCLQRYKQEFLDVGEMVQRLLEEFGKSMCGEDNYTIAVSSSRVTSNPAEAYWSLSETKWKNTIVWIKLLGPPDSGDRLHFRISDNSRYGFCKETTSTSKVELESALLALGKWYIDKGEYGKAYQARVREHEKKQQQLEREYGKLVACPRCGGNGVIEVEFEGYSGNYALTRRDKCGLCGGRGEVREAAGEYELGTTNTGLF